MNYPIRLAAISAGAIVGVLGNSPTTQAVGANVNTDKVHCVNTYEFNHAPFHASRADVEAYFETKGLGILIDNGDDGKDVPLWSYRWCGKLPKGVAMRYVQVEFKPGEGSVAYIRATIVQKAAPSEPPLERDRVGADDSARSVAADVGLVLG